MLYCHDLLLLIFNVTLKVYYRQVQIADLGSERSYDFLFSLPYRRKNARTYALMQYKLSNTVSVNFLFPEREKVVAESNRQQYSLAGFESSWLQQYCRWVRIQLDETIHINKKIF